MSTRMRLRRLQVLQDSETCSNSDQESCRSDVESLDDALTNTELEDDEHTHEEFLEDDLDEDDDEEDEIEQDENAWIVRVLYSRYPKRLPCVVFEYPKALGISRADSESFEVLARVEQLAFPKDEADSELSQAQLQAVGLLYKTHWERNCVKNAFGHAGFQRTKTSKWNAGWVKHMVKSKYVKIKKYQKINHFPDSWVIGRKDRLMRTLSGMRRKFREAYSFVPEGYSLPDQAVGFMRAFKQDLKGLWIIKPPASACGRGIRVINSANVNTIPKNKKLIVQRYITPYLVNQRKFDLRLYVLVTSFDPLRIYFFREGIVRFCTEKYSTSSVRDLKNRFGHLTNYSVNRKNQAAVAMNEEEAGSEQIGTKWSLDQLLNRLASDGQLPEGPEQILSPIHDIIVKTLIAAEGHISPLCHKLVASRHSCYELFGFDFMLDDKLRPWLIEVNISPSLMGGSPLDQRIKGLLMADVFNLVGFPIDSSAWDNQNNNHYNNRKKKSKARSFKPKTFTKNTNFMHWKVPDRSKPYVFEQTAADAAKEEAQSRTEWDIIYDLEDEAERLGHFERIYPVVETVDKYEQYFLTSRYYTNMCAKWLKYKAKHRLKTALEFDPKSGTKPKALKAKQRDAKVMPSIQSKQYNTDASRKLLHNTWRLPNTMGSQRRVAKPSIVALR